MAKAQFGNGETEGMRQREGSYNPPNRKYTLDPRFKKQEGAEIQKLSPDGRNIITEKDGMIILTDNPYDNQDAKSQLQDIETQLKLLQLQYATKLKIAKAQEQYNAKKALLNEQKEGGETVSVDPSMLAKLIAAGADIEML
jgi:hypothetical protein